MCHGLSRRVTRVTSLMWAHFGEYEILPHLAGGRLPGHPHPTGWTPPVPRAILGIGETNAILILDDTMNIGGIKVSSLELERVVHAHEVVYESAAVGVQPEGEGADKLVVYVIPAREVDTGRLAAEPGKMLTESSTRCSRSTTSSSPISFHALPPIKPVRRKWRSRYMREKEARVE